MAKKRSEKNQKKIAERKAEAAALKAKSPEQEASELEQNAVPNKGYVWGSAAIAFVLFGSLLFLNKKEPEPEKQPQKERVERQVRTEPYKVNLSGIEVDEFLTPEILIDKLVANGNKIIIFPDTHHTNFVQEKYYGSIILPLFAKAVEKHWPDERKQTALELPYNDEAIYNRIKNEPNKEGRKAMLERYVANDEYFIYTHFKEQILDSKLSIIDTAADYKLGIKFSDIASADNPDGLVDLMIGMLKYERDGVPANDPRVLDLKDQIEPLLELRLQKSNPFTSKELLSYTGYTAYRPGSAHIREDNDINEIVGAPTIRISEVKNRIAPPEVRVGTDGSDFDILIPQRVAQLTASRLRLQISNNGNNGLTGIKGNLSILSSMLRAQSDIDLKDENKEKFAEVFTDVANLHNMIGKPHTGLSGHSLYTKISRIERDVRDIFDKDSAQGTYFLPTAKEALSSLNFSALQYMNSAPSRNGRGF